MKKKNYISIPKLHSYYKSLLFLVGLFGMSSLTNAQVATNYFFTQSSGTYTPITGGTVLATGTTDDTSFPNQAIGFTFNYNGTDYTNFSVNANGFLALGATVSSSYTSLSSGSSNNVVSAFNRDLRGTATGEMRFETVGTAPNRILVMQWTNFRKYSSTSDTFNFQIRLYETTNNIEVVYGNIISDATSSTMQVGLRGASNADFNNRTTTTNWSATTAGAANNATCALSNLILPTSGQTFTWLAPPPAPPTPVEDAVPTCSGGTTISIPGSPGTNEVWYWQVTATGTANTNNAATPWAISSNGTYYVRTFNTLTSTWSLNSDSIVVTDFPLAPIPPVPVPGANPACMSTTLTAATPPVGTTYYWQTTLNGVDNTNDASTPLNITTTGTYYMSAFDATTGCWSNTCDTTITIGTQTPVINSTNATPSIVCTGNNSTLLVSGYVPTVSTPYCIPAVGGSYGIINFVTTGTGTNISNSTAVAGYTDYSSTMILTRDIADAVGFTITGNSTHGFAIWVDWNSDGTYAASEKMYNSTGGYVASTTGSFTIPIGQLNGTFKMRVLAHWLSTVPNDPCQASTYIEIEEYALTVTGGSELATYTWMPGNLIGASQVVSPSTTTTYSVTAEYQGCVSSPAQVTVNVSAVNVDLSVIDATCNTGNDGSFAITNVLCGNTPPFTYSIDGGAYSLNSSGLSVGPHTVVVKNGVGDSSAVYNIVINGAAGPSAASVLSYNNSQATITWTAGGSETSWNIEWGAPGFTPGTGTEIGSTNVSTNPFTITGLASNTEYDIYISADCGTGIAGDWTPTNVWTLCDIQAIPYFESFDTTSTTIDCWSNEYVSGTEDWTIGSGSDAIITSPYEGTNNAVFVTTTGDTTKLVSPMIDMTGQDSVALTFAYGQPVWFGDQNTTRIFAKSISGTWQLLDTKSNDQSSWNVDTLFIPHLGDTMLIAFEGISDWGHANVIDAVSVSPCTITPGVDGSMNVCRLSNTIDLNTVITPGETWGKWLFPSNQGVVSGSIFNVSTLASGSYTLYYVVETPCANDTTIATVVVYNPSNAGQDGTITACRNQPINLLSGLNGNVDMNGTWYDPTLVAMPNASLMTANFPGQYNFKYVTSNGVCPNDTSNVVVNVQSCDWLAIDENVFTDVSIYPNPSTGIVNIEVPIDNMNLEVTDINGRVIESIKNTIKAGVNTVSLKEVERGVYFFKVTNGDASKVFRVVIQ